MNKPFVSISCVTFNHEPYIRQCLDGFMMQECDFDFEILIHDDASTDKTQAIIKEYVLKYPDIIKPIYQTENQWSKTTGGMNAHYNFPRVKGKYVAMCDGDDYWTDPKKLQKQVDFMEANLDCIMCYHSVKNVFMAKNKKDKIIDLNTATNLKFTSEEFIKTKYARTVTQFFRSQVIINYPKWTLESPIGDYPLQMLCAVNGNIGYIGGEPMAVYRVGVSGSTNDGRFGSKEEQKQWVRKRLYNHKKSRDLFNENSNYKYNHIIQQEKQKFSFGMLNQGLDNFNKVEMFKLFKKYIPYPLKMEWKYLRFWVRFLLGPKTFDSLKKRI
ncbi:glycosyltransferase family 2 protein [Aequorivita capsosiphonis]|uniref:glycosyltransferase family 2 protein n=1 Tax=Aequorivita capsosiphonis TaxID=487317 RepID=UPI000402F38D|nr:glycosyltransferase [Aequorivita capsosiphonis]